jgi:hypothetical protein
MKLLVIAIICIAAFFLYQKTIGSTKLSYKFCVDQATSFKNENLAASCGVKREVYEELLTCITTVQQENIAGSLLYGPTGTKNTIELLIAEHNQACPQSLVKAPTEGIYINQ